MDKQAKKVESEVSEMEVSKAVEIEQSKYEQQQQAQEQDNHETVVKVRSTKIKYYSETDETVNDVEVIGKMTVQQCHKYVEMLDAKNVYILKETIDDEFPVNTIALIQLKGVK